MTDIIKKKNLFTAAMVDYFLDHLYQKNQDTFEQSRYKLISNLLWFLEKGSTVGSIVTTPLVVTGVGVAVPTTLAGAALIFSVSNNVIELKKESLSAEAFTKKEFQEYSEYIALQLLPSVKSFSDIYEQQIALLSSEIEVRKLAQYCSEALSNYIIKSLPNTQIIISPSSSNSQNVSPKFDVEFLLQSIKNIKANNLQSEKSVNIKIDNNPTDPPKSVSARELLKHVGLRYQDQADIFYYNSNPKSSKNPTKYIECGYILTKERQPGLEVIPADLLPPYQNYKYLVYYATKDDLFSYIGSNDEISFKEFITNNRRPIDLKTTIVITNDVALNLKNFSNRDFSEVDFTDTNLEGANFSNSVLSRTVFLKANVKDANFNGAILQNAIFDFAQLDGAIFTNSKCYAATFNYAIGFLTIKTNYNTDFRQIKINKELTQSSNYQQAIQDQGVSDRILAFENAITKADYTIASLANKIAAMSLEQKISSCKLTNIIPYVAYYQVTAKDAELFAEIDKSKIVVIKGESGAGKTQLALKHANDFISIYKGMKPVVWRFICNTEAHFEHMLKEFAIKLGIAVENKKILEIRTEVLNYIEQDTNTNYLIILDNLEISINNSFYNQLNSLVKNNNLIILITARIDQAFQASLASFPSIEPGFTIEEAAEYILSNSEIMIHRESDKNEAIILSQDLFENKSPLYLTMAKIYMNKIKIGIIQYKEILENEFIRASTNVALTEVERQNFYKQESIKMVISCLSKKALEVLKFLSLVNADHIPTFLTENFLIQIEKQSSYKIKKIHHDIIQEFESLGLINMLNGLNNELFVHREIQHIILNELSQQMQEKSYFIANALKVINSLFVKDTRDTIQFNKNIQLIPHMESILSLSSGLKNDPRNDELGILYRNALINLVILYNRLSDKKNLDLKLNEVREQLKQQVAEVLNIIKPGPLVIDEINKYLSNSELDQYYNSLKNNLIDKSSSDTIISTIETLYFLARTVNYKNINEKRDFYDEATKYFKLAHILSIKIKDDPNVSLKPVLIEALSLYNGILFINLEDEVRGNNKDAIQYAIGLYEEVFNNLNQKYIDTTKGNKEEYLELFFFKRQIARGYLNLANLDQAQRAIYLQKAKSSIEEAISLIEEKCSTQKDTRVAQYYYLHAEILNQNSELEGAKTLYIKALTYEQGLGSKTFIFEKASKELVKLFIKEQRYNYEITKEQILQKINEYTELDIETIGKWYDELISINIAVGHAKVIYDNALLNYKDLMLIANGVGGIKLINLLFELGNIPSISEDLLVAINEQGIKPVLLLLMGNNKFEEAEILETSLQSMDIKHSVNYLYFSSKEERIKSIISVQITEQNKPSIETTLKLVNLNEEKTKLNDNGQINLQTAIASFAIKELIESASIFKYVFREILGIQYLLPKSIKDIEFLEFTKHNYFWIGMHYVVSTIGALNLATTEVSMIAKLVMPLVLSTIYGARLTIYDALAEKQQEILQTEQEIKQITTLNEFSNKCALDIAAYGMLSLVNDGINKLMLGMPLSLIAYDAAISSIIGGVQCYSSYNLDSGQYASQPKSMIDITLPYLADLATFYTVTNTIKFDLTAPMNQILAIKQTTVVISSVVMTDQLTKLAISIIRNSPTQEIISESINQANEWSNNFIGNIQNYFIWNDEPM